MSKLKNVSNQLNQEGFEEAIKVITSNEQEEKERELKELKRKSKRNKRIMVILIILLILLLIMGFYQIYRLSQKTVIPQQATTEVVQPEESSSDDNPVVRKIEKSEYVEDEKPQEVAPSLNIKVPLIYDINVSKEYPNVKLFNPIDNADHWYLSYAFYISGENEPFYESDLVEPGYKFSVPIGSMLNTGDNSVRIIINTYDMKTLEQKSNAAYDIQIVVED